MTRAVARVLPATDRADGKHFVCFTSFLIGSLAVFHLTKRYVFRMAALAVVLPSLTQPLLFGHAYINPKDVPYLAFFTLTVALGFHAVDRFLASDPAEGT